VEDITAASLQKGLTLQRALKKLLWAEYPAESSRMLAELLLTLSDNIVDRLLDLASRQRDTSYGGEDDEVLVLGRAIAQLAGLAEPVARSSVGNVPWGIILPVEMLCRRISPESRVIIHPRWEYNYGYYEVMRPLKRMMGAVVGESTESLFKGYPAYFAVLSFPESEKSNVLQNAAWGHEIGHHLNVVFGISDRVLQNPILDLSDVETAVRLVLEAGGEKGFLLPDREQLHLSILEKAARAIAKWTKEWVADVLSVHLFGPASVFAFSDIVPIMHSLDQPSPEHPPARGRMAVMLDELKRLGFMDLVSEPAALPEEQETKSAVSAEFARLRELCQQEPTEGVDPQYLPALKASDTVIPLILEEVKKVTDKSWTCSAEMLRQEVFHLVERLMHEVPPCEIEGPASLTGTPASLAAIVNAGWFYRILKGRELAIRDEGSAVRWRKELDKLNELTLKAIELSDVRRQLSPRSSSNGRRDK
jgi:hypothetical protein